MSGGCLYVEGITPNIQTACKLEGLNRKYVDFLVTLKDNQVSMVPRTIFPDLMVYKFPTINSNEMQYMQYNILSARPRAIFMFYPTEKTNTVEYVNGKINEIKDTK